MGVCFPFSMRETFDPEAAPDGPRLVDAPLDEAIGRLVAHLRDFRPDIVITHDALGQLTGHPDHARTHQITLLAVEAAGHARLYPEAGAPWQPSALYAATHSTSTVGPLGALMEQAGKSVLAVEDAFVTTSVDVTPWLDVKWAAILAHRGEVGREAGPLSSTPCDVVHAILYVLSSYGIESPADDAVSLSGGWSDPNGDGSAGRDIELVRFAVTALYVPFGRHVAPHQLQRERVRCGSLASDVERVGPFALRG
ncbi:PIG-L family deacetylase [Streptomyces sp. NPDC021608]|uniref:PIG-L family deacetylase n=1 Tax=Streptomyces sp. NPDC021608 TaxID=3154903 RepID=UPI0033FE25E0